MWERVLDRAGLVALAVAIALAIDLETSKGVGFDLAAYLLGAQRLMAGEPLYAGVPFVLGPFGQFLYPPPVALLFVPLAVVPFNLARLVWLLVLAALAVAVIWSFVRTMRAPARYWAAAAAVLFFPLLWEVTLGNLTLVTLALCLLAWHLRSRTFPAGLALAAALGLKLLPVALLVHLLAAGRWRIVAWSGAGLALAFLLTLPFLSEEWQAYAGVLAAIASGPPGEGSNIVPAVFAEGPLRLVLPTVALLLAAAAGYAARRAPDLADHAFRLALAGVPLFASTLFYPYLVFALPLLLTTAPPPPEARLRPFFVAARPLAWLLMQTQLWRDAGRDFVVPFFGLLVLIALGALELLLAIAARPAVATAAPHAAAPRRQPALPEGSAPGPR